MNLPLGYGTVCNAAPTHICTTREWPGGTVQAGYQKDTARRLHAARNTDEDELTQQED